MHPDRTGTPGQESEGDSDRIKLAGEITQVAITRVNDDGFANGDVMGVYIVENPSAIRFTLPTLCVASSTYQPTTEPRGAVYAPSG